MLTRDLRTLHRLSELSDLVRNVPGLYVRYSKGPSDDAPESSVDYESGLPLPGLSVNRLDPEPWWTRPLEDWIARQLSQYLRLADKSSAHHGWVLSGEVVGRGPDDEPLVVDVRPVAILDDGLLEEAYAWYQKHFDAGRS
jgi:hypothetical protein